MAKTRTTIVKDPGDIKMFTRSGVVHGSKTWTSTQVHSSGGGGYVGPQGGHVHAARVTSGNTTHDAFFLVGEDGKEIEIKLTDVSFGVRDGHYVTAVYSGHQRDEWQWLSHLHNHNTDKSAKISSAYRKIVGNPNVLIFFAAMAVAIALGVFVRSWKLFLITVAIYAGYTLLVESPKLRALAQAIDKRASDLIDESVAKARARSDA
ncbi:MAG: hypothetical protein GC145_13060 [Caulobacter sp.]|nr:hypothetical protein [Caulobacter sp.]